MPFKNLKCYDVTDISFSGGALGDGINDDANAIQAAVDAIVTDYTGNGYDVHSTPATDAYLLSMPVLYFPPGRYRIGHTISFPQAAGSLTILGDNAIILPHEEFENGSFATADWAFEVQQGYRYKIEGLSFLAFHKALSVDTNDIDSSQLDIVSCAFQDCSVALQLAGSSGISVIEKSKFYNNIQAIKILEGDTVIVKDNWITSGNMPALNPNNYPSQYDNFRPCQIENRGFLHFETNLLVPLPPEEGAIEPAWINNYGTVKVEGIRQGGEPGSFTLINNFAGNFQAASNEPLPNAITVKNSQCYSTYGNNPGIGLFQPAIVRYVTKIPNLTVIDDNTGLVDCRIVDFSHHAFGGNPTAIKNMIAASGPSVPRTVCVEVVNNVGAIQYAHGGYVPQELYPFLRNRDSLWVSPVSVPLNPVDTIFNAGTGTVTYKFEYPGEFNVITLLDKVHYQVSFTAVPVPGSPLYGGMYTAVMKAMGYYNGTTGAYRLYSDEIVNYSTNPAGGFPTPGPYNVTMYWDGLAPGVEQVQTVNNRIFCIEISGVIEPGRISVAPLFAL